MILMVKNWLARRRNKEIVGLKIEDSDESHRTNPLVKHEIREMIDFFYSVMKQDPDVAGYASANVVQTKMGSLPSSGREEVKDRRESGLFGSNFRLINIKSSDVPKYLEYIKNERAKDFYVLAEDDFIETGKNLSQQANDMGIVKLGGNGVGDYGGKKHYFAHLHKEMKVSTSYDVSPGTPSKLSEKEKLKLQ